MPAYLNQNQVQLIERDLLSFQSVSLNVRNLCSKLKNFSYLFMTQLTRHQREAYHDYQRHSVLSTCLLFLL